MTFKQRRVTVVQLPHRISAEQERTVFRSLEGNLMSDRPCLVLDCCRLVEVDTSAIHLILCCLEEAMKRNGDVRLAGVSAEAMEILASVGADRLFRVYALNSDAIESFHQRPEIVRVREQLQDEGAQASENAA